MGFVLRNEGHLFLLIGIIGLIDGLRLNNISIAANEAYGPGLYLIILSSLMIIGGAYLVIIKIKNKDKKFESLKFRIGPASIAIFVMLLYSIIVSYTGYLISTFLFVLATVRLFGESSWLKTIIISGMSAAAFWLIFVLVAGIPLP